MPDPIKGLEAMCKSLGNDRKRPNKLHDRNTQMGSVSRRGRDMHRYDYEQSFREKSMSSSHNVHDRRSKSTEAEDGSPHLPNHHSRNVFHRISPIIRKRDPRQSTMSLVQTHQNNAHVC